MYITSPAFTSHGPIPKKYACGGEDVNPPLEILHAPSGVKSFALIVHDPDALSGDFIHWLVWNIDPKMTKMEECSVPAGSREGINDFGFVGWNGPCPHSGTHHYKFHLFALDSMIDLPAGSTKSQLEEHMKDGILEEATLVGVYRAH